MIQPVPPFWFHQRQGRMEPAGPDSYRLTAPNLGEAFLSIRQTDRGLWVPVLRLGAAGPEVTGEGSAAQTPQEAWEAAFELYRTHVVV